MVISHENISPHETLDMVLVTTIHVLVEQVSISRAVTSQAVVLSKEKGVKNDHKT